MPFFFASQKQRYDSVYRDVLANNQELYGETVEKGRKRQFYDFHTQ